MDKETPKKKGGPTTALGRANALKNLRQFKIPSHGAYAVHLEDVAARKQAIISELETELGGTLRPADKAVVGLLAVAIHKVELLEKYIDTRGLHGREGGLRPAVAMLNGFLKTSLSYAETLGMSPASRGKMGIKDRSKNLVDLLADAAQTLEKEAKN